jgi:hypothetical protein
MNLSHEHWVRMYKVQYRKQGHILLRQSEVACETIKNGMHKPGERSCIPKDTTVTVQVAVEYFDPPKTEAQQAAAERLYLAVERAADEFVLTQFPGMTVQEPAE